MTVLAGRYRLGAVIARGGMAVVHHADDDVLKRPVAVKTLDRGSAMDDMRRTAVRREALTAAGLVHPNIVRLLDYGESNADADTARLPFLVMELVAGGTLSARLAEGGAMPVREAARVCAQIAAGLAAAHNNGLVHHDVKPGNIMMARAGAKLADFGMARRAGETTIDRSGYVWGTPAYLAPEQFYDQPTTPAVDVYALGLVMRACLTGQPAWPGRTVEQVLLARACTPVPRLPDGNRVPDGLVRLYQSCLARVPADRPSARRVARLLTDAAEGRPLPHRHKSFIGRALTRTGPWNQHRSQKS
ncbi:serine/threonine-protein kinase [Paractinoplanes hotanensis]|nr:serine/threonine-protein kinase [Actinoplanes hotanensis]